MTPAQVQALLDMGFRFGAIANHFDITWDEVAAFVRENNLKTLKQREREREKSDAQSSTTSLPL